MKLIMMILFLILVNQSVSAGPVIQLSGEGHFMIHASLPGAPYFQDGSIKKKIEIDQSRMYCQFMQGKEHVAQTIPFDAIHVSFYSANARYLSMISIYSLYAQNKGLACYLNDLRMFTTEEIEATVGSWISFQFGFDTSRPVNPFRISNELIGKRFKIEKSFLTYPYGTNCFHNGTYFESNCPSGKRSVSIGTLGDRDHIAGTYFNITTNLSLQMGRDANGAVVSKMYTTIYLEKFGETLYYWNQPEGTYTEWSLADLSKHIQPYIKVVPR